VFTPTRGRQRDRHEQQQADEDPGMRRRPFDALTFRRTRSKLVHLIGWRSFFAQEG
jgi:hypothetical protein